MRLHQAELARPHTFEPPQFEVIAVASGPAIPPGQAAVPLTADA